jgi:zinc/manganese transport system substrate-binding protein
MVVGLMMLPAIASRFWSRRLPVLIAISAVLGCLSVWFGLLLSFYYSLPSGPAIVLVAAAGICCPWSSVRCTACCAARLAHIPMRCFPMRALLVLFSFAVDRRPGGRKTPVVTSFSILADMTHQVGGEHIQITNMVGPDADAHTYEPTPDDAKALLKAKLIIKNGLGFEPWLDRLVTSTETKATVISASHGVIPAPWMRTAKPFPTRTGTTWPTPKSTHQHHQGADRRRPGEQGRLPTQQPDLPERDLRLLAEAKDQARLAATGQPQDRHLPRRLRLSGPGLRHRLHGAARLVHRTEPSAAEVAALITQIRKDKVKAVFMENIKDARLLKQIADESGAQIGGTLYSDALAAEGPASTFTGLFEYNLNTLRRWATMIRRLIRRSESDRRIGLRRQNRDHPAPWVIACSSVSMRDWPLRVQR